MFEFELPYAIQIIQNQNCTKTKQNTNFSKNKLRSIQTKSQTAQNINSSFRLGFFALLFFIVAYFCKEHIPLSAILQLPERDAERNGEFRPCLFEHVF